MSQTRKSTWKWEVYAPAAGVVVLTGLSKTEARRIAAAMGSTVWARPSPFVAASAA